MLDIRLFGEYRRFAENSKPTDNSILNLQFLDHESLEDLLIRIGIDPETIGEILVNFNPVELEDIIPHDKSRISIFPLGMHLLCGASHLKGHNFITKKGVSVDYYGKSDVKPAIKSKLGE